MLSVFLLCLSGAYAQSTSYLEPQVRVGAGVSIIEDAIGLSASLGTRMSQLMYVNIGGFRSLSAQEIQSQADDIQSWLSLRHGIWAAPSFRYPHRYAKEGINWDVFLQTGFAATFSELANEEDWFLMEPAGLIGLDALAFVDDISIRVSSKAFLYNPYIPEFRSRAFLIRPQFSVELGYKW